MGYKKQYSCGICKTKPDQKSHHTSHLETEKHKDKRLLFEFKLSKLSDAELKEQYNTINKNDIISEMETIIYNPINLSQKNKKLNQERSCSEYDISGNRSSIMNTIIEENSSVSNKEALRDKIHEIHNYIRNNGIGYGMSGLKVFNVLYGLKKIEENGLIDKVGLLRPQCDFSYLLKLANEYEDEKLAELIFGDVLTSIAESKLRGILFYEIPQAIRANVFIYLIQEIDKITMIEKKCNVLLSGKIYEYFIGRDESAISELGAYFTDRHITKYCLKKVNPKLNEDGSIKTMIDMFGGSGGFTTEYINHLNERYSQQIDWNNEINKIYHYDINEDVIKSAALEFFCLTGVFPKMDNLRYRNSFTYEFGDEKYDYIFTNPPYGGDKSYKSGTQIKRDKIKEYIKKDLSSTISDSVRIKRQKQLKKIELQMKQEKQDEDRRRVCLYSSSIRINRFARSNNIKGNDKESCSLILMMDLLEVGGTAVGVLKEGVFFNKTYKDLRKCLIEKFNVREVISVPSDQFENTTTKTSIIIFDNTEEKTKEVVFRELVVERYTEDKFAEVFDEIVVIENKGDIKKVCDNIVSTATKEDILNNRNCSLSGKDYKKREIIVGDGYELVKLGDICEYQNGFAFKKTDYKSSGVPLITITHIKNEKIIFNNNNYIEENDRYNKYEIKKNDVIISLTGKKPKLCSIAINDLNTKLYLNQRCALLRNFKKITNHYFASIFNGYMLDYINKYIGNGSNQENISLSDILNIPIPIPKSQSKIQEWVDKISKPYNEKNTKQNKIKELEAYVKDRIKYIEENEECNELKFDDVLKYVRKKNKYHASDGKNKGKYRFYTSSQDKILYRDDYEFENTHILIGRGGNGSLHLTSKFSVSHDDVYVLTTKSKEFNLIYIYNYIRSNIKLIEDSFKGSTIKHSSKYALSKLKLRIPKNKQLIKELEPTFQQIETLHQEVKEAETLYKQYIQELSEEAIPKDKNMEEVKPTENVIVGRNQEEKVEKKKKKVKKSKKIVIKDSN